ncbi:MAG TPA: tripartite tricarboxylate transporter substrate binding protein [Burkholderiales bacterium]|nr:tripartite tricarboxylate transporter substrate binding protein [Burkholderiales bacterium]
MKRASTHAFTVVLGLSWGIVAMPAAHAQEKYPTRPIRVIVPSAAGGGTDISARLIAPRMSEYLGQPVVVENRAGAAMIIGSDLVAHAAPDGYTLLMGISTLTINPSIHTKLPYDTVRDFAPVSLVVTLPNVLVIHPSLPVKSVKELIAFARARPGQLNYASAGVGSSLHLSMALFLSMAKLKMTHVPYKGSAPALVDMLAGQIEVMTGTMITVIPYVRDGRLRALGVTSLKRAAVAPELPTIAEAGLAGYESVQWYGLLAPGATPRAIIVRLNEAVARATQDAAIRKRFLDDGVEPVGGTPDEFAALIRSDMAKWAKVVKDANIKAE